MIRPDTAVDFQRSESLDRPLTGRRVGVFTSVVGMGGSEVLVADVMEGAFLAGAEVVCWSEPGAAIRRICAARAERLTVTHQDWPVHRQIAAEVRMEVGIAGRPSSGQRALSSTWRKYAPGSLKRRIGFRRMAQWFAVELRRAKCDLLFVNVNGSEAASLAGYAAGVPVINCYHLSYTRPEGGFISRYETQVERRASMFAGVIAVHTSAAARDEWSRVFRFPVERTRLIYNGVDPIPLADRSAVRAELGLSERDFAFCVPGRLHPMKGHVYLIEALRQVKERLTNGCLLVCGEGDLRDELEHTCRDAGVSDKVRFLGYRTDLPTVVGSVDCVVLPSVASENLSVAVLEALMAGTPAIVTRVGGMAEAIRDGETGFVVAPGDSAAIGVAMVRMASNPEAAQRMGRKRGKTP